MLATRPTNCYSISVVGDRNDIDPSKSLTFEERTKRNKSAGLSKPYDIQDRLLIPQWKSFIANNSNKASLLNFIAVSWIKNVQSLPQGFRLILGGMIKESGKSVLLTSTAVVDILELSCASHEEADTRIFCHLQYAVRHHGYQRAVIQAADTDIILMALYHTVRIVGLQELWVQKAQKFLPCHKIAQNLAIKTNMDASLITSVLLSIYILTGCGTVSYPYHRGKKKAFETALYCKEQLKPLADYGVTGSALTINSNVLDTARFYFIRLYTSHDAKGDLSALRAHMFATTKGDLRSLPPTENAFYFHVL